MIIAREKVVAEMSEAIMRCDSYDDAVEIVAAKLCLSPEAVREADKDDELAFCCENGRRAGLATCAECAWMIAGAMR